MNGYNYEDIFKVIDSFVNPNTSQYFGTVTNKRNLKELINLTKDKNTFIRLIAAEALGESGDKNAIQALLALLEDSDEIVRFQSVASIQKLDNTVATRLFTNHPNEIINTIYKDSLSLLNELLNLVATKPSLTSGINLNDLTFFKESNFLSQPESKFSLTILLNYLRQSPTCVG